MPAGLRGHQLAARLQYLSDAYRVTGTVVNRVIRFGDGPALPHVIATLRAIVGSTSAG